MLYIEHLTKTFGEKKAVDDLSLHIAPGEIYGFIGHNGAGKTTTLKSVVGIQQFDSGRITIGGHSIQDDPIACKKMLAYIPDNPDLYEFMTGIQYLNFIADIFGVEESARQERIRKYADLFELTGDLAQPEGFTYLKGHDARGVRRGRRDLLLDSRARGGRKTLRQGRHHQGRQAHPLRHDGGGQGRRLARGGLP